MDDNQRMKKESRCCNSKAELNFDNEKIHLLQTNINFYKSQAEILEDKCANYRTIISKFL